MAKFYGMIFILNLIFNQFIFKKMAYPTVASLIGSGNLEAAIKLLPEGSDKTLLLGRYNSLKRAEMLGTISNNDANIERNRIVQAALHYAREENTVIQRPQTGAILDNVSDSLIAIQKENQRRSPSVAERAGLLLSEYRGYQDSKRLNTSFDITGRRLKELTGRIEAFKAEVKEGKLDSLQAIIDRINFLISDNVPSYDHLNEAYKLLQGRGFRSDYFDRNLHNRPSDNEVKFLMVEMIEQQLANL